jgi:hypothetical protein
MWMPPLIGVWLRDVSFSHFCTFADCEEAALLNLIGW